MLPRACSLKYTWWKGHVGTEASMASVPCWHRSNRNSLAYQNNKKNIRNEQTIACTLCKIQYLVHSNSIYILKQQQLKLLLEQQ